MSRNLTISNGDCQRTLASHEGEHDKRAIVPTVGVDFKITHLTVDGRRLKLHLWDTAGDVRYRAITTSYYRASGSYFSDARAPSLPAVAHVPSLLHFI